MSMKYASWKTAAEIKIIFSNLPYWASPQHILSWFCKEGDVSSVEIYGSSSGDARARQGRGCVRFSPPPIRPFWEINRGVYEVRVPKKGTVRLRVELADLHSEPYRSPNSTKDYPQKLIVKADALEVGFFTDANRFKPMRCYSPIDRIPIVLEHDLKFHEISVTFPVPVNSTDYHQYRFAFPQTSPIRVWEEEPKDIGIRSLVFSLDIVPEFGVKHNDESTHTPGARTWSKRNSWFRITELVTGGEVPRTSTTLRKPDVLLNLGRWRTYRFNFDTSSAAAQLAYTRFCSALEDFNTVIHKENFFIDDRELWPLWDYIDGPVPGSQTYSTSLADMHLHAGTALPFPVRFQLEVCLAENLLNEYTMPKAFIDELGKMDEHAALALLENIHTANEPVYDPLSLTSKGHHYTARYSGKIPSFCTAIRSAVVTPTTVYYAPPSIEISNRVLRRYSQYSDRFLRVRFTAERHQGRLFPRATYSDGRSTMDDIYERVRNTMQFGIDVGTRHYDFLAYGNSQFREYGAYFFAATGDVTVDEIRKWMGSFEHILSVSKYAARLGQCFSTTKPIVGVRGRINTIPDIKTPDGKHNFTDGVGRISKALVQIAADETGMLSMDNQFPSLVQFRLGGCKGVLAISLEPGLDCSIRESQRKFHATYEGLEIVRWSSYSSAHLNRQFISVLSTLGVPDHVFTTKLKTNVADLDASMADHRKALECLQREVDPNQMTRVLSRLVGEGFQETRESFVINILELWRAAALKKMKESARIPVNRGACLLGCVDEHRLLSGHFQDSTPPSTGANCRARDDPIPEIFVQVSHGGHQPRIIKGPMILARNPSLHPGDIRIVRGVDHPKLHYLKDVVVLPQTGDRDLASMCSGGDLDGDEYVVIWDHELLPREWNYTPMDYSAPPELIKSSGVTISDVISFFVTYMKNNSLGTIANAHLATADQSPLGVKDPKCLELAALHSRAVDYPKSGQPAQMDARLSPKIWPHYMVAEGSNRKSYKSRTVLGQLFDLVDTVDFAPRYHGGFNKRILESFPLERELREAAREVKKRYDAAIRRVMAQYGIATDLEVWSTFVLEHDKRITDFKMHSTIGEHAASIKETFRTQCYEAAGGRHFGAIGPFVAAMYNITKDEIHAALNVQGIATDIPATATMQGVFTSFPWLFPEVLIRLVRESSAEDTLIDLDPTVSPKTKSAIKDDLLVNSPIRINPMSPQGEDTTSANISIADNLLDLDPMGLATAQIRKFDADSLLDSANVNVANSTTSQETVGETELIWFDDDEQECAATARNKTSTTSVSMLLDKLANM